MTGSPLTPGQWQAAAHRCPCGLATDDMEEFDRHLIATRDQEPEHFEVGHPWTLDQVRTWQSSAAGRSPIRNA